MSRTPGERKEVGFSMKMSNEEMAFIEERKKELNYSSTAEVIRELVNAFRLWFGLPAFMAERLQKDMENKGLNVHSYVLDLLARHAEELGRTEAPASKRR